MARASDAQARLDRARRTIVGGSPLTQVEQRSAAERQRPDEEPRAAPIARTPPASPTPAISPASRAERRVRYTIELERSLHRSLRQYALDREADASEVVRALLELLLSDPSLAGRVDERVSRSN